MELKKIRPNPDNPRTISERDFEKLKKSIKEFPKMMELRPIVIDEDGVILGGNMRYEAMKALGFETVPASWVKTAKELTEAQKREFVIKDNSGFGDWDWEAIANEWDDLPLSDWGLEVPTFEDVTVDAKEEDEEQVADTISKAKELQEKWQTAPGQLWKLGEHRLLCGDCTDAAVISRLMAGKKADCVFTSPPYAVGVDYGETYQDTIENLREMLPKLSKQWRDIVLGDGCFAVINFGDVAPARDITGTDEPCEYPMALEYYPIFRADGWLLWSRRIWCKPNPKVHSLQCISSNRAATDWEHLWTFKTAGKAIIQRVDGELRSPLGWIDTSLMEGVEIGKETHGAGMATGIAQWMLNVHSRETAIIHEPFCGTGTTMIAAEQLKRKCFATEISPEYVAVTLQRWADYTGKTPELIEDGTR